MVTEPAQYQWSSYGAKVLGKRDLVVALPSLCLSLGESEQEREKVYEEYVLGAVPEYEIKLIREAMQRGRGTGGDRFREEIEKKLGICISNKKRQANEEKNLSPFPLD